MINNQANLNKTAENSNYSNDLHAGVFTKDIEAFGNKKTRKCIFYRNGKRLSLKQLPHLLLITLYSDMKKNTPAFSYLSAKHACKYNQIEEYIFCMWGLGDHKADFKLKNRKWELSTPENFNCSDGGVCHCFEWNGKAYRINGKKLTDREVYIIRQMYLNRLDTVIATGLGIKLPTYNTHKKTLFTKLNATSRTAVVVMALQNKIV